MDKLTDDQMEFLLKLRDEKFKIASDGRRINRPRLEKAIKESYEIAGYQEPEVIICRSPLEAMTLIAYINTCVSIRESMTKKAFPEDSQTYLLNMTKKAAKALPEDAQTHLLNMTKKAFKTLPEDAQTHLPKTAFKALPEDAQTYLLNMTEVANTARDHYQDPIPESIRDIFKTEFKRLYPMSFYIRNYLFGTHALYWMGFFEFADYMGYPYTDESRRLLDIHGRISEEAEWYFRYDKYCFCTEKPIETHWRDGQLHNENGPAVVYEDGLKWYSIQNTVVPSEWFEVPGYLTPERALKYKNQDLRRIACERLGWLKIVESLNYKIIDSDENPQIGALIEVKIPEGEWEKFLIVQCGTGNEYAIQVPPHVTTAREAQVEMFPETEDTDLDLIEHRS